ncbi:ATPase, T2SS/T4P/T4SS family [Halomonas campisalis]|uniref:ATPase, T2SS/T4P/T4SS family n=1 Tax=Billgrantia campisalis TaxID=74661 RepID=UPI001EEFDAB8|nr:ATPase, T2SS/T4P/T4SS family [Halomonas campisalis]MDR5861556.1 ATPase, T2SS/T4P/T4SS family [Halomonas campisalis]
MTADERLDRTHPQLLMSLQPLLEAPPGPEDDTLEVHALLDDARRARATDIHLDPDEGGWRIRLRIDGRVLTAQRIDRGVGGRLANQFKVLAGLNPVRALTADEGSFSYDFSEAGGDESHLRVSAVSCVAGEKLAVRFLERPRAFDDPLSLGIGREGAQGIRRWMDATAGMLLVAGPTGAGKTTTLYTLLDQLKLTDSHVMTLEDPVEYELAGINSGAGRHGQRSRLPRRHPGHAATRPGLSVDRRAA